LVFLPLPPQLLPSCYPS
jgi:hypothetical protein